MSVICQQDWQSEDLASLVIQRKRLTISFRDVLFDGVWLG